jgi:hypothetical protein
VSHPAGDATDPRLAQALDHPVRAGFLRLLARHRVLSPSEALPHLDHDRLALGNVVYHVRVLDRLELVEPAGDEEPSRGYRFRPTTKGKLAISSLGLSAGEENDG